MVPPILASTDPVRLPSPHRTIRTVGPQIGSRTWIHISPRLQLSGVAHCNGMSYAPPGFGHNCRLHAADWAALQDEAKDITAAGWAKVTESRGGAGGDSRWHR